MTRVASVLSSGEQVVAGLASQGGDGSIAPGGLTFGKLVDGGPVGKFKAEYRKVVGTTSATYKVPHGLGFVPAWAQLVACTNSGGDVNLCPTTRNYDKWTATEIEVRVDVVGVGGTAGTVMWWMIGGER